MAQMLLPDKTTGLGPELQKLAEQRMKEINAPHRAVKTVHGADLGRFFDAFFTTRGAMEPEPDLLILAEELPWRNPISACDHG